MRAHRTALLCVTLGLCAPAFAQKACSAADAANASKAIDRVVSWPSLNAAWKSWRHCDKGEAADQFTEALLRLIVAWKDAAQLATEMGKDAEYKAFIIAHLKSPAAKDDLDDIHSRARTVCPKGHEAWCKEIAEATSRTESRTEDLKPLPPITLPPPPEKK